MQASQSLEAGELQTPVLNSALLDQYKARKNNLLERLINAYLEEAPLFHQNIRKAADVNRLDDVRAGAHALKSCSYNLGAARLSKICQDLESAALNGDASAVQNAMTRIGPECFEVEQALRSELYNFKKSAPASPPAAPASRAADNDWY